jgi:hypothetical protein
MFINENDDRIIQVQNDRLFYNWRKRGEEHLTFAEIYPEFRENLKIFEDFVRECGLDGPT